MKIVDFGHYQQCLETESDDSKWRGRYVLIQILWPLSSAKPRPLKIQDVSQWSNDTWIQEFSALLPYLYFEPMLHGVCVPSVCQLSDLQKLAETANQTSPLKFRIMTSESFDDNFQIPSYQLVSIGILVILTTVMVVATLFPDLKEKFTILEHFDGFQNTQKIMEDTKYPQLSFLNGMKLAYFICCIASHLFLPMTASIFPFYCKSINTPFIVSAYNSCDSSIRARHTKFFLLSAIRENWGILYRR